MPQGSEVADAELVGLASSVDGSLLAAQGSRLLRRAPCCPCEFCATLCIDACVYNVAKEIEAQRLAELERKRREEELRKQKEEADALARQLEEERRLAEEARAKALQAEREREEEMKRRAQRQREEEAKRVARERLIARERASEVLQAAIRRWVACGECKRRMLWEQQVAVSAAQIKQKSKVNKGWNKSIKANDILKRSIPSSRSEGDLAGTRHTKHEKLQLPPAQPPCKPSQPQPKSDAPALKLPAVSSAGNGHRTNRSTRSTGKHSSRGKSAQ